MKILELRFKNLNSLYGEWFIDFTHVEYTCNGIFALTGPTGAGKSTILDAICLALYGKTPRLEKINSNSNEIMSRQTGECYAEVVFESQSGQFRCHWEQRRARKKADGKLQAQEHSIADAVTGKTIETMKTQVGNIIEEQTGMDFERFTRSILLAQGGFDTFLKADVEQKSTILEQITGTEIYSEISKRVHERQRDEREKLQRLLDHTSRILVLDPEQEQEIKNNLTTKQKQEAELTGTATNISNAITWLITIENLNKEILSLMGEAAKLKSDMHAFKPERTKLEQANKAASLDGTYATLISLRTQQADDQTSLNAYEAALPELETSANTQLEVLKTAEQLTLNAKEKLKTEAPLIKKIRSLDQNITAQTKLVSEGTDVCIKEAGKIDTDEQTRVKEQNKLNNLNDSLQQEKEAITGKQNKLKQLLGDFTLKGVREKKEGLLRERAYIKKIEELEEYRKRLEDGEACPLCGALVHPYAKGNEPTPDKIDQQISELTALIDVVEHQEQNIATLIEQQNNSEKNVALIKSTIKHLDDLITMQREALTEKQNKLEQQQKELSKATEVRKQLYDDKNPDDEESRLNKAIVDAEKTEKKARDLNTELQQNWATAKTHIDSLKKRIEQRTPELNKAKLDFSTLLTPTGFADEQAFLKARLPQEERNALSARAKAFDDAEIELKAKQSDRENRLEKENAQKLTDKTREELQPQLKECEASLQQLRETIAEFKHKLSEHKAAKERIKEQQSAIEAQEKECHCWQKLYDLIGSADGKKYRKFAQGLTFEVMINHANQQLKKMTDRYLLIRDAQQPLELNVIDRYQADEIRSTKNLSGGESFIVSLTLALGLSKMASQNVRVDSLFLDEGFGTLDEDALETALDTLSQLQQDGKLIGIISHIPALKERISTQITIAPVSGGRSAVSGPGCSKIT
jgi:DNA repair protein SbcC/Rad50